MTKLESDDLYRTCPECGRDCEPVPFSVGGDGVRVSMICPIHGAQAVIDPFEEEG